MVIYSCVSPRGSPADRRSLLPDAIILELDLADVGTLTRLIALR